MSSATIQLVRLAKQRLLYAWSSGLLLSPRSGLTPLFGANGLEFNDERTMLFVADTAVHQIIKIPVNPYGSASTESIFITGINTPDGIMIERNDNIWICVNQADEIVVVGPGR